MDAVVEANLDGFEVADGADLLEEDATLVVVADVRLVTEDIEVVVLVSTYFVEVVCMVRAVATVVGRSCNIRPSVCFSLCEKSE